MSKIISIIRKQTWLGVSEAGSPIFAPSAFLVGQEVPEGPVVKEIKYVPSYGTAWARRAHYEIYFEGSTVKRIIPEEQVIDIAVDTASQEKPDKKKKAATVAGEPDLSIPTSD